MAKKIKTKAQDTSVEPFRVRRFWLAVTLVWVAAVGLRLLSIFAFGDGTLGGENGGSIGIYTHDSGYHGYQAQAVLGEVEPRGSFTLASIIPAVLTRITPFSLDALLFFLPVLLAPLIVFPLAWLGRRWIADLPALGLALLSSFLAGFYQRSHAGYYDTDILNVFFPLMLIVIFVKFAEDARLVWLFWAVLLALTYDWWYSSARAMLVLLAGGLFAQTLLFARNQPRRWQAVLVFGLAVLPLPPLPRLAAIALLMGFFFALLPRLAIKWKPATWLAGQTLLWLVPIMLAPIIVLALGGGVQIQSQITSYLGQASSHDLQSAKGLLHFSTASGTIIESVRPSTTLYLKTFGGQVILGWLSLAALGFLVWRVREAIFLLPMIILGLLGFVSGIRFAIYLAPVALLAFAWLMHRWMQRFFLRDAVLPSMLSLVILLAPAWFHVTEVMRWNTIVAAPVFSTSQMQAVRKAAAEKSSGKWAFAWWDYGWPLWMYGGWQTIVDNGVHGQADSYLVSRAIMSTNQSELAGLARLLVEEKMRKPNEQAVAGLLQRFGDLSGLMEAAQKPSSETIATIVFPWQMRYLLFTIDKFSQRDPETGLVISEKANWILGRVIGRDGTRLIIAQTLAPRMTAKRPRLLVDTETGLVEMHEGKSRLARLVQVSWQDGKRLVSEKEYSAGGGLSLIVDEHGVLFMHERFYRSNFIQMAVLGRVDANLFDLYYQESSLVLAQTKSDGR